MGLAGSHPTGVKGRGTSIFGGIRIATDASSQSIADNRAQELCPTQENGNVDAQPALIRLARGSFAAFVTISAGGHARSPVWLSGGTARQVGSIQGVGHG